MTCVAGSGKGVSDTPVTLHIANAELAPTHPICLGLALNWWVMCRLQKLHKIKWLLSFKTNRKYLQIRWSKCKVLSIVFDSLLILTCNIVLRLLCFYKSICSLQIMEYIFYQLKGGLTKEWYLCLKIKLYFIFIKFLFK